MKLTKEQFFAEYKRGYASALRKELQKHFPEDADPIGRLNDDQILCLWGGFRDALQDLLAKTT